MAGAKPHTKPLVFHLAASLQLRAYQFATLPVSTIPDRKRPVQVGPEDQPSLLRHCGIIALLVDECRTQFLADEAN